MRNNFQPNKKPSYFAFEFMLKYHCVFKYRKCEIVKLIAA